MSEYAIYLRKSRSDLEAEASGGGDTLARHRSALLSLAAQKQLTITHIYEEVVSGETLAARPEMQKLLSAVDEGAFDHVPEKVAPASEDGLSPLDAQLMDLLRFLSDDQKKMLLAQIETLLQNQ